MYRNCCCCRFSFAALVVLVSSLQIYDCILTAHWWELFHTSIESMNMLVFLGHLHVINLQQNSNNKNKPMFVYFTILSSLYSILVVFIFFLYNFFQIQIMANEHLRSRAVASNRREPASSCSAQSSSSSSPSPMNMVPIPRKNLCILLYRPCHQIQKRNEGVRS